MGDNKNQNKLVVLSKFPGQLAEFQKYLQRRDWGVQATSDLKRLLTEITVSKPQVALISINATQGNFQKLQSILERVYRLRVIYFIEDYSSESWQRMIDLDASFENKIFGQLTGPSFERALVKINERMSAEADLVIPDAVDSLKTVLRIGMPTVCKSVFGTQKEASKKLSWVQSLTCIYVESPVLSGHFLVATAEDTFLDEILTDTLRAALRKLYEAAGVKVTMDDFYQMEVRKVEFKNWSAKASFFLESAVHNDVEVAIAFFPTEASMMKLGPSDGTDMFTISLDEIRADSKVPFELYLHLPLNGRFILYVAKGSSMALQQQMNLQSRGIEKLHVRKEDAPRVLRSRTTQYFEQSISSFYEQKAA